MDKQTMPSLQYMPGDKYVPHHALQTVTAVPYVRVAEGYEIHQEGLIIDKQGDMYFTDIYACKVLKLDKKTKEVSVFADFKGKLPSIGAVKFHKDGRMFLACCDFPQDGKDGGVFYTNPDGTGLTPVATGFSADDLVFDAEGGMYVTNFCGSPIDKRGTIEYISPDLKTRKTFIDGLEGPNGVCFSPDYGTMWITETNGGKVTRVDMNSPRLRLTTSPYRTEGFFGPDSCSCDADGNVYIAMARQGRIIVLNPSGFLIGEVITPRCEEGYNLGTTHPQVDPEEAVLYFTVHNLKDEFTGDIMCCGAFAKGNPKQFHFL